LVARVQVKGVARNVAVDVGEKIFIRGDAESGRAILPFNYECAACINIGKGTDRALIGLDIAIAPNSDPVASDDQSDACGKKYDRDLLHGNCASSYYDAATPGLGFKNSRLLHNLQPCGIFKRAALKQIPVRTANGCDVFDASGPAHEPAVNRHRAG